MMLHAAVPLLGELPARVTELAQTFSWSGPALAVVAGGKHVHLGPIESMEIWYFCPLLP
jgi:hypothetical protein